VKAVIPAKREARRAGTAGSSEPVAVPGLRCASPGMTVLVDYALTGGLLCAHGWASSS
jgi:hypothetical protein